MTTCRDCDEGKHGACNGDALVEHGTTVELVPCDCSRVDHLEPPPYAHADEH